MRKKLTAKSLLREVKSMRKQAAKIEKLDKERVVEYDYVLSGIIDDLMLGSVKVFSTQHRELNAQVFKIKDEIVKFKRMLKKLSK